jgi:hypothetical protein
MFSRMILHEGVLLTMNYYGYIFMACSIASYFFIFLREGMEAIPFAISAGLFAIAAAIAEVAKNRS